MSQVEKQALGLLDLAVIVAKAKGVITAPDQHVFEDARLRIVYSSTAPQALDVFRSGDLDLKRDPERWRCGSASIWIMGRLFEAGSEGVSLVFIDDVNFGGVRFADVSPTATAH
jgi:hypothetical protein